MKKIDDKSPFFSIITCTLNSEKYLFDNIRSIESQECTDFEHIFVDAFSNDATLSIIQDYKNRMLNRVTLYQLPAQGISHAMNFGINVARGKVILHLHSDDYLASNKVLEEVKAIFESQQAAVVTGDCMTIGMRLNGYIWPQNRLRKGLLKIFLFPFMFHANFIAHPSTYIASRVFQVYGTFDENYKVAMDYDFWFRIFKSERFYLLDKVLSVYRYHSETTSTTEMCLGLQESNRIRKKYRKVCPKEYLLFLFFLQPFIVLGKFVRNIFYDSVVK